MIKEINKTINKKNFNSIIQCYDFFILPNKISIINFILIDCINR